MIGTPQNGPEFPERCVKERSYSWPESGERSCFGLYSHSNRILVSAPFFVGYSKPMLGFCDRNPVYGMSYVEQVN